MKTSKKEERRDYPSSKKTSKKSERTIPILQDIRTEHTNAYPIARALVDTSMQEERVDTEKEDEQELIDRYLSTELTIRRTLFIRLFITPSIHTNAIGLTIRRRRLKLFIHPVK